MKLFYASGSPYARIIRVALRETGLDRDGAMVARRARSASLRRRRTRLRTTALPTRLLTVMPTRIRPRSFGTTYSTSSGCGQPRGADDRLDQQKLNWS